MRALTRAATELLDTLFGSRPDRSWDVIGPEEHGLILRKEGSEWSICSTHAVIDVAEEHGLILRKEGPEWSICSTQEINESAEELSSSVDYSSFCNSTAILATSHDTIASTLEVLLCEGLTLTQAAACYAEACGLDHCGAIRTAMIEAGLSKHLSDAEIDEAISSSIRGGMSDYEWAQAPGRIKSRQWARADGIVCEVFEDYAGDPGEEEPILFVYSLVQAISGAYEHPTMELLKDSEGSWYGPEPSGGNPEFDRRWPKVELL